ncbi:hypothetical protein ACFL4F_00400 [Candidatus Margulisiibacteriota bacterium]
MIHKKGARSKGNLLIIFIMLVGLSLMVFSLTTVVITRVKESGTKASEHKAFYVAEAGLNKAIWYLIAPTAIGGKGRDWRGSLVEGFGPGTYSITVQDTAVPTEVLIISVGDVDGIHRTVVQLVDMESFNAAFDYAIFCGNSGMSPSGSVNISGDVFINGNTDMGGSSAVSDGDVYHPDGYGVVGNADDGGSLDPEPTMPALDTSYYDTEISAAEGVAAGDRSYVNLDLGGSTVYVNGDVTISGNGSIAGPGILVVAGELNITGSPVSDGSSIIIISKGATEISGGPDLPNISFYSRGDFKATGTANIGVGSLITSGDLRFSGSMDFRGIIYALGAAKLTGDANIFGSLVVGTFDGLTGNVHITYDPSVFGVTPPGGLEQGAPRPIKGTWEEL